MKKIIFFLFLIILIGSCAKEEIILEGGEELMAGKNILMIVPARDFRDEELFEPKKVFEEAGANVVIGAKGVRTARGKLGGAVDVDKDIADINVEDYDAIVFVGGPGSDIYFDDETAISIAKNAYEQGKVVAAICIAPSILANAGILEGKKATAFSSEESNLKAKGATYTGEAVSQDGKIITGDGPAAATLFGQTIIKALQ